MERYGKYKDSGIEWIGEIPEGWEVLRLRFLSKIKTKVIKILKIGKITGNIPFMYDHKLLSIFQHILTMVKQS